MRSQYFFSLSFPTAILSSLKASMRVVPKPAKQSKIMSPLLE